MADEFDPKAYLQGTKTEPKIGEEGAAPMATPTNQKPAEKKVNPMGPLEPSIIPGEEEPNEPTGNAGEGEGGQEPTSPTGGEGEQGGEGASSGEGEGTPPQYSFTLGESEATKLNEFVGVSDDTPLTADALLAKLEGYRKRDQELTEMLVENGVFESEKLTALETQKSLPNEELVVAKLKEQGYTEEDAEAQVQLLTETNALDKQAELFKGLIDREALAEKEALKETKKADIEARKKAADGTLTAEQIAATKQKFKEQLAGVDTILGVKLGKTPEEVNSALDTLTQKAAEGDLIKDLKANPELYLTLTFIKDNFETVKSVLHSKGVETGKQSILKKITHPDKPTQERSPVEPDSSGGFDPKAFTAAARKQKASEGV